MKTLHLIVFSRAPVPGATKARLTPPLTPETARDVHVACLNHVLHTARAWGVGHGGAARLHLFITPPATQPAFRKAGVRWPDDFALHNQRGGSLGERMGAAIGKVLGEGQGRGRVGGLDTTHPPHTKDAARADGEPEAAAMLIGCDLPLLRPEHLAQAAACLTAADTVFAPTPDGGYWLVGTHRNPAPLFQVEGWGGGSVLERSLEAARRAGHRVALGPELPDVDTPADIHRILAHPLARDEEALGEAAPRNEALILLRHLRQSGMV